MFLQHFQDYVYRDEAGGKDPLPGDQVPHGVSAQSDRNGVGQ
jgi:hypothetical protein